MLSCVVCDSLKKKTLCPLNASPCVRSKRPRLYGHHAHTFQHVCAWCGHKWRRFERAHGDVFSSVKTSDFLTFLERLKRMLGSSLIDNFLFSMNDPHMGYHVLQRFTKETLESLPILSLTIGRTRNVPDSTNHSLYLIKMLSSNPEGKRWILPIFFAQSLNAPLLPVAIYSSYEARKNSSDYLFSDLRTIHTTPNQPNQPTTNNARHTT